MDTAPVLHAALRGALGNNYRGDIPQQRQGVLGLLARLLQGERHGVELPGTVLKPLAQCLRRGGLG